MRVIVTVHGINTSGKWQDRIGTLLKPHFEYRPIKYKQYRHLGTLKLVVDPFVLFAGFATLAVCTAFGYRAPWHFWGLIGMLILAGAHATTYLRREEAIRELKRQLDDASQGGQQPHLIAHSFGTYLTGTVLRRYPETRLRSVILAGSVLSSEYQWDRHVSRNLLFQLRNEIAKRDFVSRLAYFLHGLVPGMGHSGVFGFINAHTLSGPYCRCNLCPSDPAFVHNIFNEELGHSDHVFSSGYAERFWLPFLWGIEAEPYVAFLTQCEGLLELQERGAKRELREQLAIFRSSPWIRGDVTVGEYIANELEEWLRDDLSVEISREDLIVQTIHNICREIADAQQELRNRGAKNAELIKALDPVKAVYNALESALKDFQ